MEKTEKIKNGAYIAQINLSRGANCISLRKNGYKILREPDYSKELDNPYLYGMPVLFPVNRISGGKFEFEGREYRFPVNEPDTGCHLHGELHNTEFKLVYKDENKIICSYEADEKNPYLGFEHKFKIDIEYELKEDGFYQLTRVTNLSDKNMPVMLGFHTTFNACFSEGDYEDINVLAQVSEEYERNMENYLPTGNKPEFDGISNQLANGELNPFGKQISRHYRAGGNGKMVIYDKGKNLSLVYENDEKFGFRLIFGRDGYICLEPQNCLANCANSPLDRKEAGFDYIKPGEVKEYHSKIYIKEGDCR